MKLFYDEKEFTAIESEYTYYDLLRETEEKKRDFWKTMGKALKGKAGFLVKAEIEAKPGRVAWSFLAREFCEKLAAHVDEWMSDEMNAREISDIYMGYYDGRDDLYEILPTEARLFDI